MHDSVVTDVQLVNALNADSSIFATKDDWLRRQDYYSLLFQRGLSSHKQWLTTFLFSPNIEVGYELYYLL